MDTIFAPRNTTVNEDHVSGLSQSNGQFSLIQDVGVKYPCLNCFEWIFYTVTFSVTLCHDLGRIKLSSFCESLCQTVSYCKEWLWEKFMPTTASSLFSHKPKFGLLMRLNDSWRMLSLFAHKTKFGLLTSLNEFWTYMWLIDWNVELLLLLLLSSLLLQMNIHYLHCSLILLSFSSLLPCKSKLDEIWKLMLILLHKTKFGLSMTLNDVWTTFDSDKTPWKLRRRVCVCVT